jgi:hypothetical protein
MINIKSANDSEIKTNNGVVAHEWKQTPTTAICDIFNMSRGVCENDIVNKLPLVWAYDTSGIWYVALMFYIRNIRKIDKSPKGKGERLLSYYMCLWLLKNHKNMFMANYFRFVQEIGCYKDCLNLAKMAKEQKYDDSDIRLLLMPMAVSLMEDENLIIQKHLYKSIGTKTNELKLSLAAKWAPREGKAFTQLIPYLKQLCNITGLKSDMKWRKYIQQITYCNKSTTIEKLLSMKQYDMVNFKAVPSKAFNLYKKAFNRIPELTEKFAMFLSKVQSDDATVHVNDIHQHKILNNYISGLNPHELPLQIIKSFTQLVIVIDDDL